MKLTKKSIVLGALLLGMTAGAASAATVEANIPFPFVVQGKTLPAGKYVLQRDDDHPDLLYIRNQNDSVGDHMLVLTEPPTGQDPQGNHSALEFDRRGSQYWLMDAWQSGDQGWGIPETPTR